ncbi:MAG TPA: hypothetical protein VF048_04615 [Gemmatimonadaceae bacterium]
MLRKQNFRLVAGAVAGPLLASACGPDPTAPRETRIASPPPAAVAAKASTRTNATVAVDDALTRLLGSLDAATASSLNGPLIAIKAALKSGDAAALSGAVAVARNALAGPVALNDERAPDLVAISLAVDAAASGR